jgi:hypothetical protein
MATKKSTSSDRRRVSSQPHEIAYAAKTLGKQGKKGSATAAVRSAKEMLGRTTSRKKVMSSARAVARSK